MAKRNRRTPTTSSAALATREQGEIAVAPHASAQVDTRARDGQMARLQDAETLQRQDAFLDAFAKLAIVSRAAIAAGVHRRTVYTWLDEDEAFRVRYDEALQTAIDEVEAEAHRRAIDGWDEPVFGKLPGKDSGGGEIGTVRKFSDRLLEVVLKGRRPEVYRERVEQFGVTQHVGEITVVHEYAAIPAKVKDK